MRYLLLGFMTATAVLVWACSSADPGAVGTGGSGGTCMPDDNPYGSCNSTVECVYDDGPAGICNCDADAGQFFCEGLFPNPGWLPATQPKTGDCCAMEMTCGGWDTCAPICRCHDGKWTCKDPDCPLFFCPSPVGTLDGQFCDDRIGDSCSGFANGCFEGCNCDLDFQLGRGVWTCSPPKCVPDGGPPPFDDAGPPIDSGPPFDGGGPEGGP